MIKAEVLKKGDFIKIKGDLCRVLHVEFGGSAKFGRTVHIRYRNVEGGSASEISAAGNDTFEEADVQKGEMEYLYRDEDFYYFMDTETYEQFPISRKIIGPAGDFLKENSLLLVELAERKPVNVIFPDAVVLKVTEAPPGLRHEGSTAGKKVVLENGVRILAPQFIVTGDLVRINPETGKYIDRVKK